MKKLNRHQLKNILGGDGDGTTPGPHPYTLCLASCEGEAARNCEWLPPGMLYGECYYPQFSACMLVCTQAPAG